MSRVENVRGQFKSAVAGVAINATGLALPFVFNMSSPAREQFTVVASMMMVTCTVLTVGWGYRLHKLGESPFTIRMPK